ncbi:MAG: type 1 glutamine amidotransferase [Spirochaetaceae bacterium]
MKNGVLIIKNITREEPGILSELLMQKEIPYTIVDLDKNETFPDIDDYDALVVLGGPDSANDENSKISDELNYIKSAINKNIPYLGICLGLQLLVKSLGGQVVNTTKSEIGFVSPNNDNYDITLTKDGEKDHLFSGLGHCFNVFQLHGESVELTDNMTLLGYGKDCKNQIVKIDGLNAYGIQCHFELTEDLFIKIVKEDPELLELDYNLLVGNFKSIYQDYLQTGTKLFTNFLDISGVLNSNRTTNGN